MGRPPPRYEPKSSFVTDKQMLFRTAGTCLPKALPYALLSTAWCYILWATDLVHNGIDNLDPGIDGTQPTRWTNNVLYQPYCYDVLAIGVTFTIVFRTAISYNRYWESCAQVAFMSSKWGDVVVQAVNFDMFYPIEIMKGVPNGEGITYKTERFRRRIMHLISLLHAVALLVLRAKAEGLTKDYLDLLYSQVEAHSEMSADVKPKKRLISKGSWNAWLLANCQATFDGIPAGGQAPMIAPTASVSADAVKLAVIGGVGAVEREILRNQDNRVSACIGLVSVEITNRMKEGGLRVPPPIQTRMYQELSNGVMGFSQAHKICSRPFPFPFVQIIFLLLIIHLVLLPIALITCTRQVWVSCLLTFLAIESFFAMEIIARELEVVFGTDANDLDLQAFQYDFNLQLESCLVDSPSSAFKTVLSLPANWDVSVPDMFLSFPIDLRMITQNGEQHLENGNGHAAPAPAPAPTARVTEKATPAPLPPAPMPSTSVAAPDTPSTGVPLPKDDAAVNALLQQQMLKMVMTDGKPLSSAILA